MTTDAHSSITIEIAPALRVNGTAVRYQSLWLLVATCHAQRSGKAALPVSMLRARFPGKANWRMLISRAFSDFEKWGIAVGWGQDVSCSVVLLNRRRRSQGPFWIDAGTLPRIHIQVEGVETDLASIAIFLGLPAAEIAARKGVGQIMDEVAYWGHLTQALRLAQDGFGGQVSNRLNEHFRSARDSAQNDFQRRLAILKESLAWRKTGDMRRSQATLNRLQRLLAQPEDVGEMPTLYAMAHIARGWNLYSRGDLNASYAELERLLLEPNLQLVIRYNPRVRFEYLNLWALVSKGRALGQKNLTLRERLIAADEAITALSGALEAAYEADSIEAAQDVAANIGFTNWLFWKSELVDTERVQTETTVQLQAVRWISLSEWICDRFGVGGGSAWNIIFLLRIVRGNCTCLQPKDLATFQSQRPLTMASALDAVQPFQSSFSKAKGFTAWSNVAAFAIEEIDTSRIRYPPLQLANLLLETAWYSVYEHGLCKQAYDAIDRLERMMSELRPTERRFFRESMKCLPAEIRNL